jgi:hypothetical protein
MMARYSFKDDKPDSAREIIEAERAKHEAKTARLKKARLDKEAGELLAPAPGEPRARALKKAKPSEKPKGGR